MRSTSGTAEKVSEEPILGLISKQAKLDNNLSAATTFEGRNISTSVHSFSRSNDQLF